MTNIRPIGASILFACATLLSACGGHDNDGSEPPRGDEADRELDADSIAEIGTLADQAVAAGIPGISLAILRGKQQVTIARGVSDRETGEALSPAHRMRVASVAKSVVASVVLQLVEEGKLRLDDTLGSLLPGVLPGQEQVTVELLLRLESGIFDFSSDERYLEPYMQGNFEYSYSPQALVELAAAHPQQFEPGARFDYSNTNYVLLGLIVEKITGQTLSQLVERRVIEPAGMSSSSMELGSAMPAPFAHGYLVGMGEPLDVTGISASSVFGCGNLVSTPLDTAKFYRSLAKGELVDESQLQPMFTVDPAVTNSHYGMGVFRFDHDFMSCEDLIGHEGGIPGYDTVAYSSLDGRRQFAVVATSMTTGEKAGDEAAQQAFGKLISAMACK